jgi:hypothetical protein
MPEAPSVLVASGFRAARPKAVVNQIRAVAVGSVSGVYGLSAAQSTRLVRALSAVELSASIVPHSNGLRKLEIGQLQTLVTRLLSDNQ